MISSENDKRLFYIAIVSNFDEKGNVVAGIDYRPFIIEKTSTPRKTMMGIAWNHFRVNTCKDDHLHRDFGDRGPIFGSCEEQQLCKLVSATVKIGGVYSNKAFAVLFDEEQKQFVLPSTQLSIKPELMKMRLIQSGFIRDEGKEISREYIGEVIKTLYPTLTGQYDKESKSFIFPVMAQSIEAMVDIAQLEQSGLIKKQSKMLSSRDIQKIILQLQASCLTLKGLGRFINMDECSPTKVLDNQ